MQKYSGANSPSVDARSSSSSRGRRGRGNVWLVAAPAAPQTTPVDAPQPVTGALALRPEAPQSAEALAHLAPTLLVVEDDPRVTTMLRRAFELEDAGWRIVFAEGGEAALRLAQQATPDVILLDVNLPDMDGVEVFHRLRHAAAARDCHIIFLTAATTVDLGVRGVDAGLLIRKPFDPAMVIDLVSALLPCPTRSAPVG